MPTAVVQGNVTATFGSYMFNPKSFTVESWVPAFEAPKIRNYLMVGGPKDGQSIAMVESESSYSTVYFTGGHSQVVIGGTIQMMPSYTIHKYTRRKFTNEKGESFQVLAEETLPGHRVLAKLASGDYKNNPLKQK